MAADAAVRRPRLALEFLLEGLRPVRCLGRCGCLVLGHALLELGKLQFELIEELLATLGRGAERVALELGDGELQGLDL